MFGFLVSDTRLDSRIGVLLERSVSQAYIPGVHPTTLNVIEYLINLFSNGPIKAPFERF